MTPARKSAKSARTATKLPESGPWLSGFGWAVPAAFASAVAGCRFEQGDVLYADPSAYDDWSRGTPQHWLQVLDPPRSARARSGEGDSNRFVSSWGSPVIIELSASDQGEQGEGPVRLETTQGRLFTCLWRSDLSTLRARKAPEPPVLQADLQRRVESAVPHLREALSASVPTKRSRGGDTPAWASGAMLFVASVDRASDASRAKAESIFKVLSAGHALHVHDATPVACGLPDGARYHPSLVVRGIAIESSDVTGVSEALKRALYNPGRAAKPESGGEGEVADLSAPTDRFSVARHGWLGTFEPAADTDD